MLKILKKILKPIVLEIFNEDVEPKIKQEQTKQEEVLGKVSEKAEKIKVIADTLNTILGS